MSRDWALFQADRPCRRGTGFFLLSGQRRWPLLALCAFMAAPNKPPTPDLTRLLVEWTGKAVEPLYPPHGCGHRRRLGRHHVIQEAQLRRESLREARLKVWIEMIRIELDYAKMGIGHLAHFVFDEWRHRVAGRTHD